MGLVELFYEVQNVTKNWNTAKVTNDQSIEYSIVHDYTFMQIIQLMQTFKILIVIYILNNQQLTLVDVQNDKSEVESPPYCCSSCHDTELEALRESLAPLFTDFGSWSIIDTGFGSSLF